MITLDSKVEIHERTLLTVIDVVGTIGGLFELIDICLIAVVGHVAAKLFNYTISERLATRAREANANAEQSEPDEKLQAEEVKVQGGNNLSHFGRREQNYFNEPHKLEENAEWGDPIHEVKHPPKSTPSQSYIDRLLNRLH